MPGLKKSPGMADIDVCSGVRESGAEGVQSALRKARWKYDQPPLQKLGTLDLNRFSDIISSPEDGPNPEGTVKDISPVSPLVQEGFENDVSSPSHSIPLESFDPEESRLPPTPPTMNSDGERNLDENIPSSPLLGDDVRNGLSSKQSGQNMTPVNQPASPPTPDPSPPRKQQSTPTPVVEKSQLLQPATHALREGASSQAESFRTAREDRPFSPKLASSPVHLPENDVLPTHWLDTTRDLQSATIGLGDVTVAQTPTMDNLADPQMMTNDGRRSENPPSSSFPLKTPANGQIAKMDAEERNNMVYRRLREENVQRHSTVSANSGAITVGISVPSSGTTPRTLRRRNKRSSLRVATTGDINSERSRPVADRRAVSSGETNRNSGLGLGIDGGRTLKQRKARELDKTSILTESPLFGRSTLDDSPVLEHNIRNVSSPAHLGPDALDMTALTYASLQESPSAKRASSKFQADPPHKLRHFSHEDRLSRNMSVRRTSLENSPETNSSAFSPKLEVERTRRPVFPADDIKVKKNTAVKRSQMSETKASHGAVQPPPLSSNVASSATQSPLERSPGGTLRHFSREDRLENNASVRRTSSDHTEQSPLQTERPARQSPWDKGIATASPRKSMDARYLYPATTPMSVSQFSDRTDNIEIGEANGVRFYPHTNESLLVVQQASRPNSNDRDASEAPHFFPTPPEARLYITKPSFTARVEPPTPTLSIARPAHQVDSPLTNPRLAPVPPIFKVIPPTPERELDQQLVARPPPGLDATTNEASSPPRRRLSLVQRARRYSDIMFPNLGSLRISKDRSNPQERATHLSPLWRPQGFWDEYDSDEYDDFEPMGTLPRGGDTSDVGENEAQQRKGLFPRAMSKRLPGFRGTGGFLLGNSLGIDRHGTNNRRHYVSTSTRTLSKRQSQEVIKNLSSTAGGRLSPEQQQQQQRSATARRSGHFVVPFTTKKFRAKMRAIRLAKEEREREKRREKIRKSIGYRVYHSG